MNALPYIEKLKSFHFTFDDIKHFDWFQKYKDDPIGFCLDQNSEKTLVYDVKDISSLEGFDIAYKDQLKDAVTKKEASRLNLQISKPSNTYCICDEGLIQTYDMNLIKPDNLIKLSTASLGGYSHAIFLHKNMMTLNESMLRFWHDSFSLLDHNHFHCIGFHRDCFGMLQKTFQLSSSQAPIFSEGDLNQMKRQKKHAYGINLNIGEISFGYRFFRFYDYFRKHDMSDIGLKIIGQSSESYLFDLEHATHFNKYRLKIITETH